MDVTAEEIKWMCELADGFRYIVHDGDEGIIFNDEMACNIEEGNLPHNEGIISFLIQRAIEGVNKKARENEHGWQIAFDVYNGYIFAFPHHYTDDEYHEFGEISESAKLAALRYVKVQGQSAKNRELTEENKLLGGE
jgi:hypothetical protein